MCFRLVFSAKYSINNGFDANQVLILVIFMSNPLKLCILHKRRKQDKKQAILARNERVVLKRRLQSRPKTLTVATAKAQGCDRAAEDHPMQKSSW